LLVACRAHTNNVRYDAVKAGDYATTAKLLDEGGNPNAPVGKKGITAMHRVAAAGNRKLELLLEARGGKKVSPAEAAVVVPPPPHTHTPLNQPLDYHHHRS
jgi:ankyrin repeat protein